MAARRHIDDSGQTDRTQLRKYLLDVYTPALLDVLKELLLATTDADLHLARIKQIEAREAELARGFRQLEHEREEHARRVHEDMRIVTARVGTDALG